VLRRIVLAMSLSAILTLSVSGQESSSQSQGDSNNCGDKCKEPVTCPCKATAPCHCLVQRIMNLPGPNDLYYALTYDTEDCNDDEAIEEYWYGVPTFSLAQNCNAGTCEPHVAYLIAQTNKAVQGGTADFGHHGMRFVQRSDGSAETIQADTFILPLMRNSGAITEPDVSIEYVTFRSRDIGANRDVPVIAVPVTINAEGSPHHGKTRYFCFELERLERPTYAKKVKVISSRQGQSTVDFLRSDDPDDTEPLRGSIWFKYPRD
jgi:hypothetical protein